MQSLPLPSVASGEALVRIECSTICGSDLHTITGARSEATPSILGHEALGMVAEVGTSPPRDLNGTPIVPGDRVTWSTSVSCSKCDRCRQGLPQKCRTLSKYGHELCEGRLALSGGLAEFMLLRVGSAIAKLDLAAPAELLCPANCATATVAAAFRTAGETAGRRVLIFGAGMLGLTAAAFAKVGGASHVTVCDPSADRLARARRFGADALWEVVPEEAELFDLVLELSGSVEAVEACCRLAAIGADIVLVGTVLPSRPAGLDPEHIVRNWISIHGVHNYAPADLGAAIEFLMSNGKQYPFHELVEQTCKLSEVGDAVQAALRKRPIRLMVRPGEA